jgi:hypothetical protein
MIGVDLIARQRESDCLRDSALALSARDVDKYRAINSPYDIP